MTRYTVSEARKNFFRLLDAVERGEDVIFERRGKRFRLVLQSPTTQAPPTSPLVVEDEDVLAGEWTWVADTDGQLEFHSRSAEPPTE